MPLRLLGALLCCALLPVTLAGSEIPSGESLLTEPDHRHASLGGPRRTHGSLQLLAVSGQPFEHAWRLTVHERQPAPNHIQLAVPVAGEIRRGEPLYLEFWARLEFTREEAGLAVASNVIELNAPPHSKTLASFPWAVGHI